MGIGIVRMLEKDADERVRIATQIKAEGGVEHEVGGIFGAAGFGAVDAAPDIIRHIGNADVEVDGALVDAFVFARGLGRGVDGFDVLARRGEGLGLGLNG